MGTGRFVRLAQIRDLADRSVHLLESIRHPLVIAGNFEKCALGLAVDPVLRNCAQFLGAPPVASHLLTIVRDPASPHSEQVFR